MWPSIIPMTNYIGSGIPQHSGAGISDPETPAMQLSTVTTGYRSLHTREELYENVSINETTFGRKLVPSAKIRHG